MRCVKSAIFFRPIRYICNTMESHWMLCLKHWNCSCFHHYAELDIPEIPDTHTHTQTSARTDTLNIEILNSAKTSGEACTYDFVSDQCIRVTQSVKYEKTKKMRRAHSNCLCDFMCLHCDSHSARHTIHTTHTTHKLSFSFLLHSTLRPSSCPNDAGRNVKKRGKKIIS